MIARLLRRTYGYSAGYEGVLGTSLDLHIGASSRKNALWAEAKIENEIARLDAIFSAYNANSEFRRFQATHDAWIEISAELAEVLRAAEMWRVKSAGRFQPTAVRGDQPSGNHPLWEVDGSRARRLSEFPASLNAIAKGFIVDACVERVMRNPEVHHVLVNIGGDLRHMGRGETSVSISNPFLDAENEALESAVISNAAVATSGGLRRGSFEDGQWHSHIIDPRTGNSACFVASVTVVAPTAMLADVWATILSVAVDETELTAEPGVKFFVTTNQGIKIPSPNWAPL